jgi:hypothetical protein
MFLIFLNLKKHEEGKLYALGNERQLYIFVRPNIVRVVRKMEVLSLVGTNRNQYS